MEVTIDIPDGIAGQLAFANEDISRTALESLALEGYRRRVLSDGAVRRMLGFETRLEVHDFLAAHSVDLNYSMEDWTHDKQVSDENVANAHDDTRNLPEAR